ncbi:hypothetical protein TrST_g3002 [Triparma strigata]|nr:hypothetical protein TrST_g3002 [Triparma strigata]
MYGSWDVVSLLLERGADVTLRNEKNVGPLTHSCLSGNAAAVTKILSIPGSESCFSEEGKVYSSTLDQNLILSPLKASVISGEIDVVTLLLNRGVSLEPELKEPHVQPQDYTYMNLQLITLQDLCCYLSLPKVYETLSPNTISGKKQVFSFKYAVNNVRDHDDSRSLEMLELLFNSNISEPKNKILKVVEKTNVLHDLAKFGMAKSLNFVLDNLASDDGQGEIQIDQLCASKSWTPLMYFMNYKKYKKEPILIEVVKKFKKLNSNFRFEDKFKRSLATMAKRNMKSLGNDVVEFVDEEVATAAATSTTISTKDEEFRLPGALP